MDNPDWPLSPAAARVLAERDARWHRLLDVLADPLPTMTYLANESAHLAPVELYEFTRNGVVLRYTSGDVELTDADGATYQPAVIARREIQASEEDTSQSLEVEVPAGSQVATWFHGLVHTHAVWLRVRRRHRGQTGAGNQTLLFFGRVEGATVQADGRATLTAVPIRKAVRRVLPSITVQEGCNWLLYGAECGVSEAAHKFATTISANDSAAVTVSDSVWGSGSVPEVGSLIGGFIEWHPNGDPGAELRRQWITQHPALRSLTLFVHEPTIPLDMASTVWVYHGCDRRVRTCLTRFNNVANFGGFPEMPNENPFDQRLGD
jgi:hypothetical protein